MKNKKNLIFLLAYLILLFISYKYIPINKLNYIKPLFLFLISFYIYKKTNNNHGRFKNQFDNCKLIFIVLLTYIIVYLLSGLIFGYSKSPYAHDILSMILNIYEIILYIVFEEYIRSSIINSSKKNYMIIIYTIIFIFIEINYTLLINNMSDYKSLFKYIAYAILPLIFSNFLYSYLTKIGSYKLVLSYRLPIEIVMLLSPILPDYDWFLQGITGILLPVITFIIIRNNNNFEKRSIKRKKKSVLSIPLFILIIVFTLFMAGVFKYEPIAIVSNSMVPIFYRGDVVVYNKAKNVDLKKIKMYTIIVYNKEGQSIVHRVVSKNYKNGKLYFVTKGDANNSIDIEPVEEKQVIGVYQFSIKYIGIPSVWLNDLFNREEAKVEIK